MWCHLHIWDMQLLIFLLANLIPACASSSLAFHMMYSEACEISRWQYIALTYSFPNLEPVHFCMSGSNCCFLTCMQISQKAGKMVWYSHLLNKKFFPQFALIHAVKGCDVVNKAEVNVFVELSCFFDDPADVGNLIQQMLAIPLPFLNPAWTSGNSWFMFFWSLAWRILSITLLVCEMSAIVW